MPFAKLGLTKPLLRRVQSRGYGVATPIQLRAIPPASKGRDLIASAQTDAQTIPGFRPGRDEVMAVTDIAAGGIDAAGISQVINYDPPHDPADYVHQVSRTGCARHPNDAFTLVTSEDLKLLAAIEHFIGQKMGRLAIEGFAEGPVPLRTKPRPRSTRSRKTGRGITSDQTHNRHS
jgi:superfamily II DNA/RNA helicase